MGGNTQILIALGGNIPFGNASLPELIRSAVRMLGEDGFEINAVSRMYQTAAFPAGSGPDYTNAAARLTSRQLVDPLAILASLHRIEAHFGRQRHGRWQARTLDIDLIAVDDNVRPDLETFATWQNLGIDEQTRLAPDQLILPHPRLQDRAFVLVPLADVAPDWRHPVLGQSVVQMLARLPQTDRDGVVALDY